MPTFDHFGELEAYLRRFTNFGGGPDYDFAGTLALTMALLNNLREHAVDAELETLSDSLTEEEKAFILRLGVHLPPRGGTR